MGARRQRVMNQTQVVDRFEFERACRAQGCVRIAGVDEAGRGPLAGPVVAAAVVMPLRWIDDGLPAGLVGLNDSKQLSAAQRERFHSVITDCAEIAFAVAQIEAEEIDRINILQATHRAMNDALAQLEPGAMHVLVDGTRVNSLRWPQTPLVKGDSRSYSIAAASVLAKVTRDRLMEEYHGRWPHYGFDGHKGYGTPAHLVALRTHGPCPIHRRSFAPIKSVDGELFPMT
jgi:ribonuclease HII